MRNDDFCLFNSDQLVFVPNTDEFVCINTN